jgi:type IX secretion system substrate protein
MKKITLLCSLLCLTLLSIQMQGQITITQADMPVVGKAVINRDDTIPTVTPGTKGTSQTWNFVSLKGSTTAIDSFENPASTPYASAFPGANLADTTYGGGYIFLNSSASTFEGVGTVQNVSGYNVAIALSPAFVQINFPGNYGNIDGGISTGKSAGIALVPPVSGIDSVKGSAYIKYADTIDAWGTVTTPFSAFNSLRQKHYELDIDSIFVYTLGNWYFYQRQVTKNYQYRWYTNGIGDMLITMQMDTNNANVKSVKWYDGNPNGINEVSQNNSTKLFPNPCTTQVTFRSTNQNAQTVSLFDITGREISGNTMKNGEANINTSSFANGIYLYRVLDKSGNILTNGKFVVQQ